jgi:hypothetical protein
MRILIATAGVLSPEGVARIARRLCGDDGEIIVITVIGSPAPSSTRSGPTNGIR